MALWANPSSPHAEGRMAGARLEEARARIAAALGWDGAMILTSGASEAIASALGRAKAGRRFVSAVEHDAVRRTAPDARGAAGLGSGRGGSGDGGGGAAAGRGAAGEQRDGNDPACARRGDRGEGGHLARRLRPVGRQAGPAGCGPDRRLRAQAGRRPPGIGALLVRDLALLEPSGGQEGRGYRGGTENLPGALGFAAALEAEWDWLENFLGVEGDARRRDHRSPVARWWPPPAPRLPTIASYRMPGWRRRRSLIRFDLAGISVSAGSACSSGSLRPSPVLSAMGWDEKAAGEVIRVSMGWTTTEADVARFISEWSKIARGVRAAA